MMSKILIAGGSGFFGTNLVNHFYQKKIKFIATFHSTKPKNFLKKYYQKFNLENYSDCLAATKNKDTVIICAKKKYIGIKAIKKTFNITDFNIRSNLFEACYVNKVKKVIWLSSATVYQPHNKKISEQKLDLNIMPYKSQIVSGLGYRYLEQLANYYKEIKKMNITIVRTSLLYGPFDNFKKENSHVVPGLIVKALESKNNINIWGNGKITRDIVYIDDLVKFITFVVFTKKKFLKPINFSFGKSITIENLAKTILKVLNKENIKIKFTNKSFSSSKHVLLDNKLSNKIFKIKKTSYLIGIKKTIDWYKKNRF